MEPVEYTHTIRWKVSVDALTSARVSKALPPPLFVVVLSPMDKLLVTQTFKGIDSPVIHIIVEKEEVFRTQGTVNGLRYGNLFTTSQGKESIYLRFTYLFGPMSAYIHEHPPSCSLPTPFSNMPQECHSDSDGKAKSRVTSNTSTFCMPSSSSPFTLALPFTKGLKLPHVELGNNDSKKKWLPPRHAMRYLRTPSRAAFAELQTSSCSGTCKTLSKFQSSI